MGDKRSHILSKTKGNFTPKNCIYYDCETSIKDIYKTKRTISRRKIKVEEHTLKLGYYEYWYNNELKDMGFFYTQKEFTEIVLDISRKTDESLFVFAHNHNFDFVVGIDTNLLFNKFEIKFKVIDNNFILKLKSKKIRPQTDAHHKEFKRGKNIVFLDSMNYFKTSIEKMGKVLNPPIKKIHIENFRTIDTKTLKKRCQVDVIILRRTLQDLFTFLKENNLGSFKYTIASLSFNIFRNRFMNKKIFIHERTDGHEIERRSYFGGRTECFFIGEFNKPVYKLDINSHYPYAMIDNYFPTKLIKCNSDIKKEDIKELSKKYLLIADVTIKTDKPFYPIRYNDRVVFPTGEFKTTLCTPELLYNFDDIVEVNKCAVYEKEKLFKDFVTFFYNLKVKYTKEKNESWVIFTKINLNASYGMILLLMMSCII